jgi:hypothetical protein
MPSSGMWRRVALVRTDMFVKIPVPFVQGTKLFVILAWYPIIIYGFISSPPLLKQPYNPSVYSCRIYEYHMNLLANSHSSGATVHKSTNILICSPVLLPFYSLQFLLISFCFSSPLLPLRHSVPQSAHCASSRHFPSLHTSTSWNRLSLHSYSFPERFICVPLCIKQQ